MGFEIILVNAPPVSDREDIREALAEFFINIGYHSPNYDPRTDVRNVYESVPYRIFAEHFIKHPATAHKVDDMASKLKTTVATIYRHLNKIKRLDVLDEVELEDKRSVKPLKGYRPRFGSFPMAWQFTEMNISLCLDNYRRLAGSVWDQHGGSPGNGPDGHGSGGGSAGGSGEAPAHPRTRGARGTPVFRLRTVDVMVDAIREEDHDLLFLRSLDYISSRGIIGKSPKEIRKSVGYRLIMECLVGRCDRVWSYDELCLALDTTFPTVSRYINKMRALDLLDEVPIDRGPDEVPKKGFCLRHGDLTKAWNVTEAQAKAAVRNYRKSVDHLDSVLRS